MKNSQHARAVTERETAERGPWGLAWAVRPETRGQCHTSPMRRGALRLMDGALCAQQREATAM